MNGPLTALKFTVEDEIDGEKLTPGNVDLPLLRDFLEDVEILVRGNDSRSVLANSKAKIFEGSLGLQVLVGESLATNVINKLGVFAESGDFDVVDSKRAAILEKWQKKARANNRRVYAFFRTPEQTQPLLKITAYSDFTHKQTTQWAQVEKYLKGKLVDLGGKRKPNVHLVQEITEESILIESSASILREEKENHLYKNITLRVKAEQHLATGELRNIKLVEFVPTIPEEEEDSTLKRLWERGREAWADVPDSMEFVEELRGN